LGYKTDITKFFRPDIYRFVGDINGFRTAKMSVLDNKKHNPVAARLKKT
jgi:hypothetical protein